MVTLSRQTVCLLGICAVLIFVFNVYIISLNLVDPDAVLAKVEQAGVRSAIILQQRHHSKGGKGLRRHDGGGGRRKEFIWSDVGGGVEYRLEKSRWVEVQDGVPKFYFQEVSRDEEKLVVRMANASRRIEVLVTDSATQFRYTGEKEWVDLYIGSWTRFDGVEVSADEEEAPEKEGASLFRPPPPQHSPAETATAKIVLLLAAYKDPLCGNTLAEAFMHAKYPERIYASVVQQNGDDDLDCLKEFCRIYPACPKDHVTIIPKSLSKSRGVMAARYHQLFGIKDEQFCLQTDSHSAFEEEWDVLAIGDWLLTNNEMAVLSTYPNKVEDRHFQQLSPARCSTKFSNGGRLVHGGNSAHNVRPGRSPYLVPFFGAGVAFSKCHANLLVPYDPYMSYLFGGEEFNRAVRLFTWGYDIYAPKHNFVYHYYDGEKKPVQALKPRKRDFFSGNRMLTSQTTLRWRRILGLPLDDLLKEFTMKDVETFGLGTRRTLAEYLKFSGVDLLNGSAESRCKKLGKMKWVPYVYETPFYPAGDHCRNEVHKCCHSLEKSKALSVPFLDMENTNLARTMERSSIYQDADDNLGPIISPLAKDGGILPLPCPQH